MRYPAFVIVGSPRSGTTLVQRVVCELDGVRVPPETHFFTEFATALRRRWPVPLDERSLRDALDAYRARPYLRDIPFDVDSVVTDLGGRCASVVDLFSAVVGHLAGEATVLGEKTPGHLLWWRPLTRALPELKVICVVRDPRAVVASFLKTGWGHHAMAAAQRWRDDARRSTAAAAALGPRRCLMVRYEEVVDDPARTRASLAAFLGVPALVAADGTSTDEPPLFPAWESWKATALGPVDAARAEAWRQVLTPRQHYQVVAACRPGMTQLGYEGAPSRVAAARTLMTLPPGAQRRRLQQLAHRYRRDAEIARMAKGWPVVSDSRSVT